MTLKVGKDGRKLLEATGEDADTADLPVFLGGRRPWEALPLLPAVLTPNAATGGLPHVR